MLKRLVVLGLLCLGLVGGASPQVPGNESQQKQPPKATDNHAPAPTQSCLCNVQVNNASPNQTPEPDQRTSEYPWRELYAPANVPSLLLFAVAIWAGYLALQTLGAIKFQADVMEGQTIQLERQVEASHDGLRAWIGIDVRENKFPTTLALNMIDQISGLFTPSPPRFEWEIKNFGQTPAFVKTVEVSNFAYDTPTAKLNPGKPLAVNGFLGAGQSDAHLLTLCDEGLNKCEAGQMFWRVSVKVIYEDAFGREHETMFSFHYFVPQSPQDPRRKRFYQDIDRTTNYYN